MPMPMQRRGLLIAALGNALGGCGFELRRAPELKFRTVQLLGFAAHSPLANELRMNIDASAGTKVVEPPAAAEVVLEALSDSHDKGVVASTSAGQVREIQVRAQFNFRLRTLAGKVLIPPTLIALSRELSYSEDVALAKEQEEALLYRAMQTDIVSQVMRRLAAVSSV